MDNKKYISLRTTIVMMTIILIVASLSGGVFGFWAGLISGNINVKNINQVAKWLGSEGDKELTVGNQIFNITEDSATIEAVKKVSPAVVSVVVTKDLSQIYSSRQFPFDDFFFDLPFDFNSPPPPPPSGKREVGGGTGFVIDAGQGLIITNKHVVSDEQAEYSVLTSDGESYDAEVLARDPFADLAILKVSADNLTAVQLGDSDQLVIGQTVIAIGNVLGEYSNTVTRGVVSGIGRTIVAGGSSGSERLEGIIQTDAAINPGNSGGPLINLAGQVVGINTAVDRQGQSVGFAIPIDSVKKVIESVEVYGRIIRPYLGVRYILINEAIAQKNNLGIDYGALIVRGDTRAEPAVIPGSPADKAGLRANDIILEVNGDKITEEDSLAELIQRYSVGDTLELKILRQGDEEKVEIKLGEYKE